MAVSILMALTLCAGCAGDDSLTEIALLQKKVQETDDEVVKALKAIPEISDIKIGAETVYGIDAETNELKKTDMNTYNFNFTQPVDYQNPSSGTYTQRVRLIFKGFDKNVVLYSHGYAFNNDMTEYTPLAAHLDANQIEVEHRYFGNSLPENFEDSRMTYLNADQQAHDIHNIVSTLRKSIFCNGKWASTGVSKDGITTALQAYYSDKYNWHDIDVFVPFCAPFLTGTTNSDGSFSCMDSAPGVYLHKTCGSGYKAGTAEAIGYERLRKIPYYICTNEKIRQTAIEAAYNVDPAAYQKILNQYHQKSEYSTGDLNKDLTAFAISSYLDKLYDKFSNVLYSRWASLIPDIDEFASGRIDDEDFDVLKKFFFWGSKEVKKELAKTETVTRGSVSDIYWDFLQYRRAVSSAAYRIQGFKELGIAVHDYSCVDGTFLTAKQCYDVNYIFTEQSRYQGAYPQDRGKLMKDFLAWVEKETTMPLIFVYARNDPWTGGGITSDRVKLSPMVVSVVDSIAMHNDRFHSRRYYTQTSENAIVEALNKFLK